VKQRTILGVSFTAMNREQAAKRIDEGLQSGNPLRIAFANAHTLNVAARNALYRNVLRRFLVLNDGIGVDLASRIKFGRTFPENLNGTDFVPYYLSATRHNLRIFLLGAERNVVSEAARRFAVTWPRHTIVGACDGYFSGEEQIKELCRAIRDTKPDLLLLGLG